MKLLFLLLNDVTKFNEDAVNILKDNKTYKNLLLTISQKSRN